MARSLTPTVVLVCLALASCNRPVASKTAHETSTSRPATQGDTRLELHDLGDLAQAVRPPAQIVEAFLVAVREGDHRTTAFLLTDKARVETAKHDLVVEPPGTPSAKFVIGDVEFVGEEQNGAHVNTVWTESDPSGETVTYDVVWALRRQRAGWRVAGIATEIVDGEAPIFLNFEDPGDMLQKWQRAEEIAVRYQQQSERHAVPPNATPTRR